MSDAAPDIEAGENGGEGDFRENVIAVILAALADRDPEAIERVCAPLHPADVADILEQLSGEQVREIADLAPEVFTGPVLAELRPDTRELVTAILHPSRLAAAIQDLESDDAAMVFEELDVETQAQVLAEVPHEDRTALESSLAFDEETAGRLMQREFVAAVDFWTVGQTIDHMRQAGEDLPDLFYEIYVVDPAFKPVGAVALSRLVREPRSKRLNEIMEPPHILVHPETDQEDVAHQFAKYHLISAPVIDADGRLTGMLTVDDMVDVIHDEHQEDLLALAGVNEAGIGDTVLQSVRSRAPWLVLNLVTAILASAVIAMFEDSIAQLVALAVLMPIVASMGGNAGTQTLAVAVRSLATRELTPSSTRRAIKREALAGLVSGLIFAVLMGAVAVIWFGSLMLALVIAMAMIITLAGAGLSGILIPLALKRFGADPAVASSVLLTTITDVVGFFAFLGLATIILL